MYKRLISLSFALCLLPLLSFASDISVRLDNKQIIEGESFHLSYTVMDENQNLRPDFTPLQQDFSILATSETVHMNIVNGTSHSSKQFLVVLTAKKSGDLEIPPIQFGNQQSKALPIHVLSPSQAIEQGEAAPNFIEGAVSNENPYVQSEVVYTLRLFTINNLIEGSLGDPEIENASLIRLGQDHNFQERRYGQLYHVVERKYAIFPQQSGQLTIQGPMFSGTTQTDPLGSINPFINMSMKRLSLTADNIRIDVQAIPAKFQGSQWLPATQLSLSEHWSGDENSIHVGDPLVRQITIEGSGLLASQLPTINSEQIQGANSYSEQVNAENHVHARSNIGKRVEQIVYIPTESGSLNLPPLEISWWNTDTNSLELAQLPAKHIQVLAAAGGSGQQGTESGGSEIQPPTQIINPINPQTSQDNKSIELSSIAIASWENRNLLLPWGIAILTVFAWLLTIILWYRSVHQQAKTQVGLNRETQSQSQQYSMRKISDKLKKACDNNDKQAAKKALLLWAKHIWPQRPFHAISDIMAVCSEDGLSQQLNILNQALYGQSHSDWQGQPLWDLIIHFKIRKAKKAAQDKVKLPPLYLND